MRLTQLCQPQYIYASICISILHEGSARAGIPAFHRNRRLAAPRGPRPGQGARQGRRRRPGGRSPLLRVDPRPHPAQRRFPTQPHHLRGVRGPPPRAPAGATQRATCWRHCCAPTASRPACATSGLASTMTVRLTASTGSTPSTCRALAGIASIPAVIRLASMPSSRRPSSNWPGPASSTASAILLKFSPIRCQSSSRRCAATQPGKRSTTTFPTGTNLPYPRSAPSSGKFPAELRLTGSGPSVFHRPRSAASGARFSAIGCIAHFRPVRRLKSL